jgi:hypothetical protein
MMVRWQSRLSLILSGSSIVGAFALFGGFAGSGCASSTADEVDQSKLVYEADWARPILGADGTDQYQTRRYLSESEEKNVEEILRSIAAEWQITELPVASPGKLRWVDMDDAVRLACDDSEVATTSKAVTGTGMQYGLLNIVGLPGSLVITRTDDDRAYTAQCQIGLFPGLVSNQASADLLIKNVRKQMELIAAERRRFLTHEHAQAETFEAIEKEDQESKSLGDGSG